MRVLHKGISLFLSMAVAASVTAAQAYELGSSKIDFEPGKYTLPVAMMKASDTNSPSMAGSCIKSAVLEVAEDDTANVTVEIGSVTIGSIVGYAKEWTIYQSNDTTGEKVAAEYTTDDNGNVDQIKFTLPDNTWDGVYANMYIDVMATYQDAYLAMDFDNAKPVSDKFIFGSESIQLSEGVYKIPVSLMNASSISSPSAAASAVVKDSGRLTVKSDGSAELYVGLQAVTVGAISDWAEQWEIYQTNGTTGDTVSADFTTNEDGKINSITFTIPDNTWDGVYTNMYVPVMGYSPDAYFAIDYRNAVPEGESVVKTYTGTGHVEQFGKYDVIVTVTVTDGIITAIEVTGENFDGTYADYNKMKLQQAADGLKDKYTGLSEDDAEAIYSVDAVSSATISSQAIRDAIMNALELVIEDEIINVPTEKLSEGEYEVEIALYSDVVKHSLVENETAKASISVDADGNMTLSTNIINGTSKEPLYVLEFNGYYEDNDTSGLLTKENAEETKEVSSYSDEYMTEGTETVTNVSFPLAGEYAKIYNTNFRLYVPAMNALNGELSGVFFENGKFNVDCYAKIYWDSIEKISGGGYGSTGVVLDEGAYRVPVTMMKSTDITSSSMANGVIKDSFVTITENGAAEISIDLQPLTVMDITAWAKDWKIYQTQSVDGEPIAAAETTNSDGNVVNIKFSIPDNSWDGVYCNMNSGRASDAYLAIDWSKAKLLSNTCDITAQKVSSDENIVYNITVMNNAQADKTGDVVCALYSDKQLAGIAVHDSVELSAGKNVSLLSNFDLAEYDEIKVFVWDDISSMSPLFEGTVFSQSVSE